MITINNQHYVKNDEAIIDSLFNPINGQTASGTYKKKGRKHVCLYLYNMKGELFAYICRNKHGHMAGNAKQMDDAIYHQYALSSKSEQLLGFDTVKYSEQSAYIESIINQA